MKLVEISNYVGYSCWKTIEPTTPFITKTFMDEHRQQRRKLATGEQVRLHNFWKPPTQFLKRFFHHFCSVQEIHIAKHSKGNVELYLQVPSTVPSFDCCPIIKVEYVVEVRQKILIFPLEKT